MSVLSTVPLDVVQLIALQLLPDELVSLSSDECGQKLTSDEGFAKLYVLSLIESDKILPHWLTHKFHGRWVAALFYIRMWFTYHIEGPLGAALTLELIPLYGRLIKVRGFKELPLTSRVALSMTHVNTEYVSDLLTNRTADEYTTFLYTILTNFTSRQLGLHPNAVRAYSEGTNQMTGGEWMDVVAKGCTGQLADCDYDFTTRKIADLSDLPVKREIAVQDRAKLTAFGCFRALEAHQVQPVELNEITDLVIRLWYLPFFKSVSK